LWWDLRPSARYPTLEMRIADVCTNAAHGSSVAAIYQCVLWMLLELKRSNQRWRNYSNMLVEENRWRAQRYGIDSGLIDFGVGTMVPFGDLVDELLEMLAPAATELGCLSELSATRQILETGTSAHRQVAIHQTAVANGAEPPGGTSRGSRLPLSTNTRWGLSAFNSCRVERTWKESLYLRLTYRTSPGRLPTMQRSG
jgi:carboxylate-amine ligase